MYVPDTLERLNQAEVDKHYETVNNQAAKIANDDSWAKAHEDDILVCDYCDKPATITVPIYNPADSVRNVSGVYSTRDCCKECEEEGYPMEDTFFCEGCGKTFITNHSWDTLCTVVDGIMYCQSCALEEIEPVPLYQVIGALESGEVQGWHRINNYPGHDEIWSGEYSGYSDFPGHTSTGSIASELEEAATEAGYSLDTLVIPLVTHDYQFSVVLGVFLV